MDDGKDMKTKPVTVTPVDGPLERPNRYELESPYSALKPGVVVASPEDLPEHGEEYRK